MINIIAEILGKLLSVIYNICDNYALAILMLAILLRILLLPLNIIVQKNSIKMLKIKPSLEELKMKYHDDKDKFMEEQIKIHKQERYRPLLDLLPLLIKIFILMGLTRVLTNLNNYNLYVTDSSFWKFDLLKFPSFRSIDINSYFLVIVAFSTILLCYFQNKANVLQVEESKASKFFTNLLTIFITIYFSVYVPIGVCLYWSIGNILSIFQLYLLNFMYNPKKYIDYEKLNQIKKIKKELEEINKANRIRAKQDYKRFLNYENKKVVIYSEASGFYKYFKSMIEYITENSDIIIHYITNDPNDQIFNINNEKIEKYYINQNLLIPLFMKINSDIVIMTTPDLQKYYLKRSMVRKDIEYIFTDHGLTSVNLGYREGALDYYDTIFATSQQQVDEIQAIEKLRNTKPKTLIKTGYVLIDEMIEEYKKKQSDIKNNEKTVLIAPSWQEDNIMDSCLDEILDKCLNKNWKVIVRPHPQYIKRNPLKFKKILEKYEDKLNEKFEIQENFSSIDTVYNSDIVITDWSAIGYEFAFSTLKPCIFINTKMKIINPSYDQINVRPIDVELRNKIGKSIKVSEINNIEGVITDMLENVKDYKSNNEKIRNEYLFNVGNVKKIQGEYIIRRIGVK